MWWIKILLFYLCLKNGFAVHHSKMFENEPHELAEILFDNLRADPNLIETGFSDKSKKFIDEKVENFMQLMWKNKEKFSRARRSLRDEQQFQQNNSIEFQHIKKLPTRSAIDVVPFQQNFTNYALLLEKIEKKQHMVILKEENGTFTEIFRKEISKSQNAAVLSMKTFTFIVVAKQFPKIETKNDGTDIFKFDLNENITSVQTIKEVYANHVAIWKNGHDVLMSLTESQENSETFKLSPGTKIYKWRVTYFDLIQSIDTTNLKKITPFSMQNHHFIALVNSEKYNGFSKVYSKIMKYDMHQEHYIMFQKILSSDCHDIKYFEVKQNEEIQHFLVVANSNEKEDMVVSTKPAVRSVVYKLIENYFTPFQSMPSGSVYELEVITNSNGDAIIIVATNTGTVIYQYNGWHFFQPKNLNLTQKVFTDMSITHAYQNSGKINIVVVNLNGTANIYEVTFFAQNEIRQKYNELLDWCESSLKNTDSFDQLGILTSEGLRGDLIEFENTTDEERNELTDNLKTYNTILNNMENKMSKSLRFNKNQQILINNNITTTNLVVNVGSIKSLNTKTINNENIQDVLENTLNMNDGFSINTPAKFQFLFSEESLFPNMINGFPSESYLRKTDAIVSKNLIINGTATFDQGAMVTEKINNNRFTKENVLLRNEDQTFEKMTARSLILNNVHTVFLNKLKIDFVKDMFLNTTKLKEINTFHANNVAIGGLMNGLNLSTLEKYTLRKSGDQNITAAYYFDNLTTINFNIKGRLSSLKVPNDLISTESENVSITQDVVFKKNLSIKNFTVLSQINNIHVSDDGKLDVCLKSSKKLQELSSEKTFKSLNLKNPILMMNKINSKQLKHMNPLVITNENITTDKDVIIMGNVLLKKYLTSKDVVTENQTNSLLGVREQGLKLEEKEILVHMTFSQTINSNEIFADKVNNVEHRTWVVNDVNQTQIIQGWKQFKGDLRITGPTNVFNINNVNVPKLEASALKIQEDQLVTGVYQIQHATALKGILSNNTLLGAKPWAEVMTTKGNEITSGTTVINGNLVANNIVVNNIEIVGLVNNVSFTEFTSDIVKKNAEFKVYGHKFFSDLTIENLLVSKTPEIINQLEAANKKEIRVKSNLYVNNEVSVENIKFTKSLNNIKKEKFEQLSVQNDSLVINGNAEFDKIVVFGNVLIKSNQINDVNLTRIVQDTVKKDEPFEFGSTTTIHGDVVVKNKVDLQGNIEHLDIDNIFAPKSDVPIISNGKVFQENVAFDGVLTINNYLNRFNLTEYCELSNPNSKMDKMLVVQGNAIFAKGPNVFKINGHIVKDLENSVWFVDRPTTVFGRIEFRNISFENNVTVKGFVDDVDLQQLSENYFSKAKNQTISSNLTFSGGITFEKNVSVPEIFLDGRVNNIELSNFIEEILLDNKEQTFENRPYFENVFVEDLSPDTEYLVNNLYLEDDIMRYDKNNKITGKKYVKNLDCDLLKVKENVNIQNVDINYFLENVVQTQGVVKIPVKKIFNNAYFKDSLSLQNASLNDKEFNEETVLLRNVPQMITGKKIFIPNSDEIYFKSLKVKGYINDVDLAEFLNHQAYNNQDNSFKSSIDFENNISANDLHVDGTFNGINMTELVKNISSLKALDNLVLDYKKLLDISTKIKRSIQNQAFFMKYYKESTRILGTYKMLGVTCGDNLTRLISFQYNNGINFALPYEWNNKAEQFIPQSLLDINFCPYPTYLKTVYLRNKSCVYIESQIDSTKNNGYTHIGKIIYFENSTHIEEVEIIPGNGTSFLTTFKVQPLNQDCFAFVNLFNTKLTIMCYDEQEFYLMQEIPIQNIHTVSFEVIDNETYLIAAKNGELTSDPAICIWKFIMELKQFEPLHHIYEGDEPKSLTTTTFNGVTYLAIGYGRLANTMHLGRISIRRFNKESQEFVHWQNINLNAPISTEFAMLPSNELVLYVLTEDMTEPFMVYLYEGISGFQKKFTGSTMQKGMEMNSFSTTKNEHFVVMQHDNERATVIQATFKGMKWND